MGGEKEEEWGRKWKGMDRRERDRERNPRGKVLASTTKSLLELSSCSNYRRGMQTCLELLRRIFNFQNPSKKVEEKKEPPTLSKVE